MATPTPTPQTASALPTGDRTPSSTSSGKTVIADPVIAKIAGIAVREVSGVYALGGGVARVVGAVRDAIGNTDLTQGVSVEVGETEVAADITLVAAYPAPLQQIADQVRTVVARAIEELVGMQVAEVNVTISDVHVPSDDDTAAAGTDSDSGSGSSGESRVQ